MSLSVYLEIGEPIIKPCPYCNGTGTIDEGRQVVFDCNITHNLVLMAEVVGLFLPLWHPENLCIVEASQLIEPLRAGLQRLTASEPDRFRQYEPADGWGKWEDLVEFTRKYLAACVNTPYADVRVSK